MKCYFDVNRFNPLIYHIIVKLLLRIGVKSFLPFMSCVRGPSNGLSRNLTVHMIQIRHYFSIKRSVKRMWRREKYVCRCKREGKTCYLFL